MGKDSSLLFSFTAIFLTQSSHVVGVTGLHPHWSLDVQMKASGQKRFSRYLSNCVTESKQRNMCGRESHPFTNVTATVHDFKYTDGQ